MRGLFVSPAQFRHQMKSLKLLGYQGCSINELMSRFRKKETRKVFGITFDDGYEDVYIHALPILQELGFTATTYFVSAEVGGFNRWDVDSGIPQSACMTLQQLREWKALGQEVGGHTVNHRRLGELAQEDARSQIADCRHALEDMSGDPVEAFSYPYGSFNPTTPMLVREAGFTSAVSTRKKRTIEADDPYCLPRLNVRYPDMLGIFLWKCLIREL